MSGTAQPVGDTPEPKNDNPQPVGAAAEPKPSEPFKAYATAEDFEAHKAKLTEAKDRELAKMRAENEALRKKNETEQEKAIREAKEAGAAEAEARVKAAKLEAYLEAKGLTGASLKAALAVAPDEWEAVSDAGKVIEEALPGLFGSKSKTIDGGGGRMADGMKREPWTQERLSAHLATLTYEEKMKFWREKRDEVNRDISQNVTGTMTTIPPGFGLQSTPTVESTRR